jgi:hypothetical protein
MREPGIVFVISLFSISCNNSTTCIYCNKNYLLLSITKRHKHVLCYISGTWKSERSRKVAVKQIRVSDLTGEEIGGEENHARLVVTQHPNIPESVELDVRPEEVERIIPAQDSFVFVQYTPPSGDPPFPFGFSMTVEEFNNLLEGFDMETVLQEAYQRRLEEEGRRRGRRQRRGRGERRERIDYSSPEYAGLPHRGRITEAEKAYVRNNLDEVNRKRVAAGHDPIDPTDPRQAEKYGLTTPEPV